MINNDTLEMLTAREQLMEDINCIVDEYFQAQINECDDMGELSNFEEAKDDLTSVLCIVGSVFAVLSRYAVNFWNQGLHQGASLSMDKTEHVSDVYWLPLLVCIAGFVLLFVTLVLLRTRTEIRARRLSALLARERLA